MKNTLLTFLTNLFKRLAFYRTHFGNIGQKVPMEREGIFLLIQSAPLRQATCDRLSPPPNHSSFESFMCFYLFTLNVVEFDCIVPTLGRVPYR